MKNKYCTNFKIKFLALIFSRWMLLIAVGFVLDPGYILLSLLLYHFVLDMCITCYVWPQYDEKYSPTLNQWNMKHFVICILLATTITTTEAQHIWDEKCLCTTNTINALIYVNKRKPFHTNKRAETNRQMKNISMMF